MNNRDYMIEVKGLTKCFGYKKALNRINLLIMRGECLAIFGPNGAGKTTLIQILSSLMRPTSGQVLICGYDVQREGEEVRKRIGVISHQTFLYDKLTAFENLEFYGRMYNVKESGKRIEEVLERVGLRDHKSDQVQTLSRGMRQRLSLARAILHEPSILLLDEPYAGLDQSGMETFKGILEDFIESSGTTIMTSHDLERALEVCSRVAIMSFGVVVFTEDISRIKRCEFQNLYFNFTERRSYL